MADKRPIAIALFFVLLAWAMQGSAQNSHIDSLVSQLAQKKEGPGRVDLLLDIANEYNRTKATETALGYCDKALEESRRIGYVKGEADAQYFTGRYKFSALYPYDEVSGSFIRALKLYEQSKDSAGSSSTLLQLGVVNYSFQNYADAALLFQRCIEHAPRDTVFGPMARYLLGLCYSELGEYDQAGKLLEQALKEYAGSNKERKLMVEAFRGKLLINQGAFKESIAHLQGALDSFADIKDTSYLAAIHTFLSTAYMALGDIPNVIKYGELAIYNLDIFSGIIYYLEAANNLHRAYAEMGQMDKAYAYLLKWHDISDSISGRQILERIANQKAQYDFEKEILREKAKQELEHAVSQEELRRQRQLRNIFIYGFIIAIVLALVILKQRMNISKEKAESEKLLLNILPEDIAQELKTFGKAEARNYSDASIIFTDFKEFTQWSEKLSPAELVREINLCFEMFDSICEAYQIEKIKTIGDSYMAAGGLPVESDHSTINAVLAAIEMADLVLRRAAEMRDVGDVPFEMRVGVHTGTVVAGIVGVKKFQYDVWGDTVNTASRMESNGEVGRVNISQATYEKVKNDPRLEFEHRGKIEAKGKGEIDMYFVRKRELSDSA